MRKHLPDPQQFIGLSVDGDYKIAELIGEGCNALVFKGFSETVGNFAAYKVIPSANLAPGNAWKTEAQKANALGHNSVVRCTGHEDWRATKECVVLKYDYVDGMSLKTYIKKHKDQITVPFIRAFLQTMLDLFYEMSARDIEHGDFHAGNILVMKPSRFQRNATETFMVTDFGIRGVTSDAELLDDYEQLARVLTDLLACVNYQRLSPEDKYIYNVLNDHFVSKHLKEKDTTLDPLARNPDALLSRLEEIDAEYIAAVNQNERGSLLTPFDYLSCEQIGQQHSLLHALYSEKFLGISEIEGVNNLVVTGPRGCGKSTVFRSLSLRHRIITGDYDKGSSLNYIGIYYHCDDLYFKFPRYTVPERAEALDLPLHYITCCLLIEILDTLRHLARKEITIHTREGAVCRAIWKKLDLKRPDLPNSDSFDAVMAALEKECQWVAEKHRFARTGNQPIKELFGPDKLLECCGLLQAQIPELNNKPFFCFIDDYSMPRISGDLQKTLNRLLMQRNQFCFFKMATESPVSYVASDIEGKSYIEGREFEILNLGLIYLTASKERKLEFLDDVFSRRLQSVKNYPVSNLSALVGDGDGLTANETAERIASGEKPEWWGRATLSMMCSGDIHQVITIVRKMVADVGGQDAIGRYDLVPRIQPKMQNKTIRAHAGNFLQSLADSGNHGERLRKIVSAFGTVANSYLRFKRSKNEEGNTRHQASRIELHDAPALEGEAREVFEELLRYSVFIQDPRGKSIRGNTVPRLYLRRFLVPHFNLTFSLRDSVLLEESEFRDLLLDPEGFEDRKRLRSEKAATELKQVQEQLQLGLGEDDGGIKN